VRKGPCQECTRDLECGSDVIIFGPPDGAGAGHCKTLPADLSGKKYCSYQRVGQCTCGSIDDGTGSCRPQSNSCVVIGCALDQGCPTSAVCSVNPADAGAGACGTCVAAPLDQLPVAQLTACPPAQLLNDPNCMLGAPGTASFNLATISPDEITLSAVNSTDDHGVVEYRFTLLPPIPGGATTAALANNGVRSTTKKVVLTIPPGVTGTFRILLEVWDTANQKSATASVITVNIYP
jgi:hypothetical protein